MKLFGSHPEVKNAELDCTPQNDYASEEGVARIDDVVDPGEKVHYLAKETGGGVDVERSTSAMFEDGGRLMATMGDVRTAATDERVLVKIPQVLGCEERSIPYDEITAVEADLEGMYRRLTVRTPDRAYHVDVGGLSVEECREMARFVREKCPEASAGEPADEAPDGEADAADVDADPDVDPNADAGPDMVKS